MRAIDRQQQRYMIGFGDKYLSALGSPRSSQKEEGKERGEDTNTHSIWQ